jgi:hypothetical protein
MQCYLYDAIPRLIYESLNLDAVRHRVKITMYELDSEDPMGSLTLQKNDMLRRRRPN